MKLLQTFTLALWLVLAPAILSATDVAVGQLWFTNDGGQQFFTLYNYTGDPSGVNEYLKFENLTLTVTFADATHSGPIGTGGTSFLPNGGMGYTYTDTGTSNWVWDETNLIVGATLSGNLDQNSFHTGSSAVLFSSNGVLSANLNLGGNTGGFFATDPFDPSNQPADIMVGPSGGLPVPEPSTMMLLAGPALGFLVRCFRKTKHPE